MTRFLSEALQAPEPKFRLALHELERANHHPNADIHLTSEVMGATRAKLAQLGLDPQDTTEHELYRALEARLKQDDVKLIKTLRTLAATHVSAEGDANDGMIYALQHLDIEKSCFALRPAKMKLLLKKMPPKRAMKRLGYRSLDSMLKHESPALILAAAELIEPDRWRWGFREQYKRLTPTDFETRPLAVVRPTERRWKVLSESVVAHKKHNLLSLKEFGTIVLLPLPKTVPTGATTASLLLALHALNDIRISSTFLKLCQVRPDFGNVVRAVVEGEPTLRTELLDQPVSWHLIHRSFSRLRYALHEELLEPHMRFEDLAWDPIEHLLQQIEPSFKFWQGSDHLGVLHHGKPISCNLLDAALNACNQLPFERRVAHYFQRSLWHELLLRYLQPKTVERTMLAELQPVAEIAS